ncbi:MAG TPA: MarR family transcriptional regulator [Candidatus Paceibacterota bacterium]|nr:MAG: hypothetical protein B7X03_00670 [Parcubacteria group bacterium 21-58-10]OYV83094.1 MAG: hypothetical protein B7W96_00750 [Parcubacteria group bacterium 37-58-5]HQT83053.1 MarR family transcriptional regulator [Candidatus Paceibacterota bacterium]
MKRHSALRRPHTPEDIARAASLFFSVRRLIRTELAKGKRVDPSTWVQMETMKFIAEHDQPKMKEVAAYLSITAPSATSLIRGLVKSGLVAHIADRRDRRASRLALTTRGKAKLSSAIAHGTALLGELFSTLSEEELAAFVGALERIKKKASA